MSNKYGSFIRDLRKRKDCLQEEVAKAIGVSRPTYIAIEKGTKQLTLDEAKSIARFFDVTIKELLRGGEYAERKFEEMIFAFLRNARESKKNIKKTKLAKLLYFADFTKYYFKNKSISGLEYRRIEFGPVPDEYFRILQELEDEALIEIQPERRVDGRYMYSISDTVVSARQELKLLSAYDKKLITDIWNKWKNARTGEIVKYTHHQAPYRETAEDHIVSYDLIKKEEKATIF